MGDKAWIYYLAGGLLLALVIGAIVLFFLHRKYAPQHFKRSSWRKLYRLVEDQDWYLLNNVVIKTESDSLHISHLLVGDKFVYVISTRYYEDDLRGDSFLANKWQVVDKRGAVLREVSNPVFFNERRTMCLAKFLGWNPNKSPMFISIVVINNSSEASITDPTISPYSYLIHKKDLCKLIRKIERETNCSPFNQESLEKLIPRLHRLSVENSKEENSEE
ncbi:MAG: NERD domain-containing protein [Bacilli bacterium]|jgi:hypothetical protein|nr:NERD domain-containing protein [Bacilli bacterium]